jgi:DNA-binding XRE family transcriptional regulator
MLSPQQLKAVEYLASGMKRVDAAKKLGINRKTLWEWERDEEFQAEVQQLLKEARMDTVGQLRKLSSLAVATLQDVMTDPDTPPATLASTAFKVLQLVGFDPTSFALEELAKSDADFTPERLKLIRERIYGIYSNDGDED